MDVWCTLVLAAALALGADVPGVARFQAAQQGELSASTLPGIAQQTGAGAPAAPRPSASAAPLQPESQLLLTRYVSGEFAKALQPIPGGKKGFKVPVGKPLDAQALRDALRLWGTAANPGDTVQITKVEFRSREIWVQINGGGKKKFHLREHLQIGVGAGTTMATTTPGSHPREGIGGTLILDYGRALPDMSPDDLKRDLSILLDFSKQHSAAVNWVETLPPQYQQAIRDRKALVGMDHEMVLAAMGRPEKKVRQRDPDGNETEDWIYGTPPARTTFVTFLGDSVIRVKEFD
jgi:hypothetical protein